MTEISQLTEFSRFAARVLLPSAILTAGLPLMPAHTVMHPQGTAVVAQSICTSRKNHHARSKCRISAGRRRV